VCVCLFLCMFVYRYACVVYACECAFVCNACVSRHALVAGTSVVMTRAKGATITTGWDRHPMDVETLTLTVYGRSRSDEARAAREKLLRDLIADALATKEVSMFHVTYSLLSCALQRPSRIFFWWLSCVRVYA
jgi:hypothetical protein